MDFWSRLFKYYPSDEEIIGTWKISINLGNAIGEDMTLYGINNKFASVSKLLRIPNLPDVSRLYIYQDGDYYIRDGQLFHTFSTCQVIYNVYVPEDYANALISQTLNSGPSEIVHYEKTKLVTKGKSGFATTAVKITDEVNPQDLDKFSKE